MADVAAGFGDRRGRPCGRFRRRHGRSSWRRTTPPGRPFRRRGPERRGATSASAEAARDRRTITRFSEGWMRDLSHRPAGNARCRAAQEPGKGGESKPCGRPPVRPPGAAMKTSLSSFARTLPIVAALAASAALVSRRPRRRAEPAAAAWRRRRRRTAAGYGGGYRGYGGGYRGWLRRRPLRRGGHWRRLPRLLLARRRSGAASASASASAPSATTAATTAATTRRTTRPYYDGYYDPALVVAPVYSTGRAGRAARRPAGAAGGCAGRADLLSEEWPERRSDRVRSPRMQPLGDDPARRDGRCQHLPARDVRVHGRARLHRQVGPRRAAGRGPAFACPRPRDRLRVRRRCAPKGRAATHRGWHKSRATSRPAGRDAIRRQCTGSPEWQ